ncbi:hypothetical protein NMG60_11022074 [Bertholletia excelsa]
MAQTLLLFRLNWTFGLQTARSLSLSLRPKSKRGHVISARTVSPQLSPPLYRIMAGCLQSLSLRLATAGTLPHRRRNPSTPATQRGLLLAPTSNSYRTSTLLLRKIHCPIRACHSSDQVSRNGNVSPKVPGSATASSWTEKISSFASNNFLPLALVGGVILGLTNPSLGHLADRYYLSKFSTFGIFLISGLTLRGEEIGAAAEAWPVAIFGLGSILLFTPLFSRLILQLQLQPREFVTGLAIFCCMPTTLSSGVALTRLAGGNSALALAMTVISSLLGILIVPFSISMFIAGGVGVSVPAKQLFRSLVLTLLVPLLLGKVLRESFKGIADFVDQNRKLLSDISALLLALVSYWKYEG